MTQRPGHQRLSAAQRHALERLGWTDIDTDRAERPDPVPTEVVWPIGPGAFRRLGVRLDDCE